jgi:hypothetical protein
MKTNWKPVALALIVAFLGGGTLEAPAQQADWSQGGYGDRDHHELHIQHTVTTSQINFPQSLYMYHVLDGANSNGEVHGLWGTISLTNHGAEFSEVLWELAYWQGQCPADDQSLAGANIFWTDIQKNPSKSQVTLPVDLHFHYPLPMTGCIGLIFAGGPLVQGAAAVTMSADLHLEYMRSDATANAVVGLAGEYCFGQNWGCQNATTDDADGFAVPIQVPAGHLVELYGDISDSTFDGTTNFGPLSKGQVWGATNDYYLLPGGCGQFGANLNSQGSPNPTPLATLHSWLPHDALHLLSVPMDYQIPEGETSKAPLTMQVEALLPYPVKVDAGDCVVVIYGRKANGATDNESQVNAVLAP